MPSRGESDPGITQYNPIIHITSLSSPGNHSLASLNCSPHGTPHKRFPHACLNGKNSCAPSSCLHPACDSSYPDCTRAPLPPAVSCYLHLTQSPSQYSVSPAPPPAGPDESRPHMRLPVCGLRAPPPGMLRPGIAAVGWTGPDQARVRKPPRREVDLTANTNYHYAQHLSCSHLLLLLLLLLTMVRHVGTINRVAKTNRPPGKEYEGCSHLHGLPCRGCLAWSRHSAARTLGAVSAPPGGARQHA
ncbi:hypothetical protein E2C01_074892 [Portunus trituberculatus]|uniref:Uncharacterized protein n=1 Tax=Portunus trituberculatus TaxID=210409 RepID=A0A5B7IDK7_PORTR|nr:hypothetical protein [Portunus trituberculatus]